MKGPYRTRREGSARLHRAAVALCRQAHLLPAALVAPVPRETAAELAAQGLSRLDLALVPTDVDPGPLAEVAAARVPLEISEAGRVRVFRPLDGAEEHYAVEIGAPDRARPVLARLHSACFTGDLVGSLKCDCGPQLRAALAQIGLEGAGVLLYLNQEGRGSGSPTRCAPTPSRTRASTRWRPTTASASRTTSATSASARGCSRRWASRPCG
jgi:GTP cyclohydrolase II